MKDLKIYAKTVEPEALAQIERMASALYLTLHDDHGFGQKRINRLKDHTQETLDAYVEKYEIATVIALYRDLAARGIIIKPRREEME